MNLAQEWSKVLNIPLNPASDLTSQFQIRFQDNQVIMLDSENRKLKIDFDENHLDYKRKHRGKSEILSKALGASKGTKTVLDLSVGMAVDSVFLMQLGFQVIGVERSDALYLLLSEAFKRTQQEILKNYQLVHANSLDFLKTTTQSFDAIYFDPMYPHKKKSALPKQEMVVFRELVGDDADASKVLEAALKTTAKRIVVKRPMHAEPLLPGVTHSFEGKVVRFDTYIRS